MRNDHSLGAAALKALGARGRCQHVSRYSASLLLAGALALPCTAMAASQSAPATDLPVSTPESQGVDSATLIALSQWLREENYDIRSLLVVKDNALILERYTHELTRDHNYELYSVTKTVVALLAGMLIEEGRIGLEDDIASIITDERPDLAEQVADKQAIQLRHVLSMASGLAYDFDPEDDPIYFGSPDRLKLVANTDTHFAPGSDFEYTDVNPVFATAMLSAAANEPLQAYAAEQLFKPLGMKNYAWERADEQGLVSGGWGLRLRPTDMAKLGELIINDGKWQGEQLVPAAWIEKMSTPKAARDFGYYLWINHIVDSEPSLTMMGFKGQFVTMLPKRNTVVVMTSMLPIEGGLRHAKNVRIFRDIVNDYVIPGLEAGAPEADVQAGQQALTEELKASLASQPDPGVFADATDAPQR